MEKIYISLHTRMWGVFKALVGKIATGGVFTTPPPPNANALSENNGGVI